MASKKTDKFHSPSTTRKAYSKPVMPGKAVQQMQDDSSDDEDMEKNFELLRQKTALWKTKGKITAGDMKNHEDEDGDFSDGDDIEKEGIEEDEDEEEEAETSDAELEDDDEEMEEDLISTSAGGSSKQNEGNDEEDEKEEDSSSDEEPEEMSIQGAKQNKFETDGGVRSEFSNMSFEELIKLQNQVGTKAFNKVAFSNTTDRKKKTPDQMKRLNKHKPQEISSKQRVPFLRKVVPVRKMVSRDPRFDDLSGDYKPEIFSQTYKFITELQDKERKLVKKELNKAKSEAKKEELKCLLKRMDNQERERRRKEQQREKDLLFKKKQRELVGQGHRPFFPKKSDKKKLELAEKFRDLKRSGKLENFMAKKRKRNATKDRRHLPKQHQRRQMPS